MHLPGSNATSPTPGRHANAENSVYALWDPVQKDPFDLNPLGGTNNLRLDCGKGVGVSPPARDCSTALEVLADRARYRSGILFGFDTLAPQADGLGAVGLAPLQALKFYHSGPVSAWRIFYDGKGGRYDDPVELNGSGMNVTAPVIAPSFRQTGFIEPSSSRSPCAPGQFGFASGFLYTCSGQDHWQRTPLSDF